IPTHQAIMDIVGLPGLEIAVSNTEVLLVYDRNLNELWRAGIGDYTGASGPVGFDFEADGKTNVTYSDETRVWVYNATGVKIYDAERGSVTMTETVAIADIDNDGHANVLVGSNEPQFGISYGLDALTNTGVSWAHARGMWNQHAYVEDLVGELGALLPPSSQGALQGFRTASAACE
ncbi:MAG: FG-GAP repeat domain-containing protein, partial [Myxococcota bacterium]